MTHRYRFPVKGTYYYSADIAFKQQLLTVGRTLYLHREPDNTHDSHALQIWTHPNAQGYLIGYVPRQLAKQWQPLFALQDQAFKPQNIALPVQLSLALAKGKRVRLECEIALSFGWLKHLQLLSWTHWLRQQNAVKWWLNHQRKHNHPH